MENLVSLPDAAFIKKGRMKKSPLDMNPSEQKIWEDEMRNGVREFLFSIGQPLVYKRNGKLIAEYPDGCTKSV